MYLETRNYSCEENWESEKANQINRFSLYSAKLINYKEKRKLNVSGIAFITV